MINYLDVGPHPMQMVDMTLHLDVLMSVSPRYIATFVDVNFMIVRILINVMISLF